MEVTKQDIRDLVAVTVGNLRSSTTNDSDIASDVRLDGDNILIGDKPIPIYKITACRNSAKKFIELIKGTLK